MPGWLDWFEEEITCPNCGSKIIVLFCEDGDTSNIPPTVKTFIVDENAYCPNCKAKIIDEILKNN